MSEWSPVDGPVLPDAPASGYPEGAPPLLVEVFPPGDFIREEMQERGWTFDDLAREAGMDTYPATDRLARILEGRGRVTASSAVALGRAFGTSWEFWLNVQKRYDQASGRGRT